jgi:hypothetical protein
MLLFILDRAGGFLMAVEDSQELHQKYDIFGKYNFLIIISIITLIVFIVNNVIIMLIMHAIKAQKRRCE